MLDTYHMNIEEKDMLAPIAPIMKLSTPGRLGILCPHCDRKVERVKGYFRRAEQTERCPACMEHYIVKVGDAK